MVSNYTIGINTKIANAYPIPTHYFLDGDFGLLEDDLNLVNIPFINNITPVYSLVVRNDRVEKKSMEDCNYDEIFPISYSLVVRNDRVEKKSMEDCSYDSALIVQPHWNLALVGGENNGYPIKIEKSKRFINTTEALNLFNNKKYLSPSVLNFWSKILKKI